MTKTGRQAKVDIQAVKSRLSTVQYLNQMGYIGKSHGGYSTFHCPLHTHPGEDSNESFAVYHNSGRWECFTEGIHGDLFDLIQNIENIDFATALRRVAGELEADTSRIKKTHAEEIEKPRLPIDMSLVEAAAKLDEAHVLSFAMSRGIDPEIAEAARLGYELSTWRTVKMGLNFMVEVRRFTIPHFIGGECVGVKLRRDDKWCMTMLGGPYNAEYKLVGEKIANERPGLPKQKVAQLAIDTLFGPKYIAWSDDRHGNSSFSMYGIDDLRPGMAYALAMEAELDALALRSYGLNAVGGKRLPKSPHSNVLSAIQRWVILADNDDKNQGVLIATETQAQLGKGVIEIVPDPFKGPGDVLVYGGPEMLKSWIEGMGIAVR